MKRNINSRKITDLLPNKWTEKAVIIISSLVFHKKKLNTQLKLQLLIIFAASCVFLGVFFVYSLKIYDEVKKEREEKQQDLVYWENAVKKHPDFPDAYYQAAWYSYVLREKQKAYFYINKALVLDPDFEEAEELRRKIVKY